MQRTASWVISTVLVAAFATLPLMAQRGAAGHGRGMGGGMSGGIGGPGAPGSMGHGGHDMDRGGHGPMTTRQTPGPMMPDKKSSVDLLAQNEKLSSRLSTLLPPGSDVLQAASGFRNLGEFVSAVHVSRNLDIPFEELKARMTGPDSMSLGKAIKELKPEADSKAEVKKAKKQAEKLLQEAAS